VASDYVLRLIGQIALLLAKVLQLRKFGGAGEARERISKACLKNVGLPFALVKRAAPETILEMLASGGGTQHVRAIILAELRSQDAKLAEPAEQKREALISRAQARALIAHKLAQLSAQDQTIYRAKLDALI